MSALQGWLLIAAVYLVGSAISKQTYLAKVGAAFVVLAAVQLVLDA